MNQPITAESIKDLLRAKGLKNKDLSPILSLTAQQISNIMTGSRKISESEQKLLRLYFYGEIPFGQIADNRWEVLSFTLQEAEAIRHFAQRLGITPEAWIVEQIRTILAIRKAEQALEPSPRAVASKRA